jgi:hypothetical protein
VDNSISAIKVDREFLLGVNYIFDECRTIEIPHVCIGEQDTMRIYDIFRGYTFRPENIRACIRIQHNGRIEWAYCQEEATWQGFWWANDVKSEIERTIQECPILTEFLVSDLTVLLRDKEPSVIP